MHRISTLLAIVLCLACGPALAQWQWIDKEGRRVFSDRAPPSDIPIKNILKQPSDGTLRNVAANSPAAAEAPARAASAAATPEGGAAPKLSAVDKDLAERKKQTEAAEAAKTKAETERIAKARAENCERARANKTVMESGVRVSVTNSKGEREIIDDTIRNAEIRRAQTVIDAQCK
ncbi:MAG: DUF4124 domain-containing protein [Burkholderiaceae bacterium]